jgi:hypothetical protein
MTPEEIKEEKRWARRKSAFMEAGLNNNDAHDLAARLMMRDRDPYDDRRVCFECSRYMGNLCLGYLKNNRPTHPLRFILQRCDKFKLKQKKSYGTLSRN